MDWLKRYLDLDNKTNNVLLTLYALLFVASLFYILMPQVDFYLGIVLRGVLDKLFPVLASLVLLTAICLLVFTFKSSKRKLFIALSATTLLIVPAGWAFLNFINIQETHLSGPELLSTSPNGQSRIEAYHFYDGKGWSFVNFDYELLVLKRDWRLPKTLLVVDQYNRDQCAIVLEKARQKPLDAVYEPNKAEFDMRRLLLKLSGSTSVNEGLGKLTDASLQATEYAFIMNLLRNEKLTLELSKYKKSDALQRDLKDYRELKAYFFEPTFISILNRVEAETLFNNSEWNDRMLIQDAGELQIPWQKGSMLFRKRYEQLVKLDAAYDQAKADSKQAGIQWLDNEHVNIVGEKLSINGFQHFCEGV